MSRSRLTPKPLHFTAHATQRMKERHFDGDDVKRILYLGDPAKSSHQVKGMPTREARQYLFGKRLAKVIYTDHPAFYLIITVEWVT